MTTPKKKTKKKSKTSKSKTQKTTSTANEIVVDAMTSKVTQEPVNIVADTVMDPDNAAVMAGDELSLNPDSTVPVVAVHHFRVDAKNPTDTAPPDPGARKYLTAELKRGTLVRGSIVESARSKDTTPRDPKVMEWYLDNLSHSNVNKIKESIIGLVISVTKISMWNPMQILEKMMHTETNGSNRRQVVDFLEEGIRLRRARPCGIADELFDPKKHAVSSFKTVTRPRNYAGYSD